jgi:hypothetical protein
MGSAHRPILVESSAIEKIVPHEIKWHGIVLKGSIITLKSGNASITVTQSTEQIWDQVNLGE